MKKTPNLYKHSGFANHTGCVVPTDSRSNTQTAMAILKRIYFWHVRTTIHLPNDVPMTSLKWTTNNTYCQFQPVPFISLDDFRFEKGWWQPLKPCIFNEVTFFETAPDFSNASRRGWTLRPFFGSKPQGCYRFARRRVYCMMRLGPGEVGIMASCYQLKKPNRILATTTVSLLPHMGMEIET